MVSLTAARLLRQLNDLDENPRVEAKTGSEPGKSVLQTVCAFANEPRLGGGTVVFGVTRTHDGNGRRYTAVGVPDPDKLQADLASQCASVFNRPLRPEMRVETVDGKALVCVYVPESPAAQKPVYFQAQGLPRGAYRRIGSADQRCTEDDLLVFYTDRQPRTVDQSPLADVRMDELDPDAIADYRRERARTQPAAEELAWPDEDLLIGIGCAVRIGERVVPTVAGVLLFGQRALLRRVFPMTRLDYIRVPGREWVEDPERRFETIDMRDPIIRLIRRAEAAILDDLPRRFTLAPGQLQRDDVPRIPDRVVREAVVNALMHRSYRTQGATQIIRYSNRVEIRNPGHSLKSEDRLGEPGSETRNPLIAAVLHETAFAETKGSGIRVMRRLLNETNLAPPTFESDRGRDQFVATFFLHSLLDDEDLAWLAHFTALNLTTDEARALVHIRKARQISNSVYRDLNGVDTLEASAHLRRLRDFKLLKQHDRGAATYYTPTEHCLNPGGEPDKLPEESDNLSEQSDKLPEESDNLPEQSDKLPEQSDNLPEQSDKLPEESDNLPGKSDKLPEESDNLPEQSDKLPEESDELAEKTDKLPQESDKLTEQSDKHPEQSDKLAEKSDELPEQSDNLAGQSDDLWEESDKLGEALPPDLANEVARLNQWTPQPDLRRLIQRLCAWRPMSTGELASLLGRSRTYLRTSYVGPMVQAGELGYTNPEKPNDPGQRYRSTEPIVDL